MLTDTTARENAAALTVDAAIERADDADADAAYAEHVANRVGGLFARANAVNANRAAAAAYQDAARVAYANAAYADGIAAERNAALNNRIANRLDA